MTDQQTELNELHEAMVECGIFKETRLSYSEHGWGYTDDMDMTYGIEDPHALSIARGVAEEWLMDRGWFGSRRKACFKVSRSFYYVKTDSMFHIEHTLTAAIRYAQKQEKGGE